MVSFPPTTTGQDAGDFAGGCGINRKADFDLIAGPGAKNTVTAANITMGSVPPEPFPVAEVRFSPEAPPPAPARGSRRTTVALWLFLLLIVVAAGGSAAVIYGPKAIQWWEQRGLLLRANVLAAAGDEHLRAGRYNDAERSARQALQILPAHARAKFVAESADTQRTRLRQREEKAASALAAAAKLAAADDLPAAIAAYSAILKQSSHPPETIRQAEQQLAALRGATGTLVLPDNWPPYTVLSIDGNVRPPAAAAITGIPLGKHTLTVTRHGHRPPPPVTLHFRGTRPVPMPAIAWQPVGGKVTLTSEPPGARVWQNGKDTGKSTPCSFEDVDVGKVAYLLKLPGRSDASVEGVVASAAALDLTASLPVQPRFPGEGNREGERQEFNLSPTLRVPFRWCPPGSFTMGGSDAAAMANEKPARTVRLTKGFWLAETEFTQAQWQALTDLTLRSMVPSDSRPIGHGPDHPIYFVSWDRICGDNSRSGGILGKINAFFRKHGDSGWVADLPTEAQWEYACRAGTATAFATLQPGSAAFDSAAWHAANSNRETHPVGTREANPWGFKDMHGNVFEWCRDWYQDDYQKLPDADPAGPASGWKVVVRGGSCQSPPAVCRSAARGQIYQSVSNPLIGFRLALHPREAPAAKAPKGPARTKATPPSKPKPKPKAKPKPAAKP